QPAGNFEMSLSGMCDSIKKSQSDLRSIPGPSTFYLKKINTGFYGSFPTPSSNLPLLVLFPFYPVLCLQKGLMTISKATRSQTPQQRQAKDLPHPLHR